MQNGLAWSLCFSFILSMGAPAYAGGTEDSCHQIAVSGQGDPLMFSQICKNKDDLAMVCDQQVKNMGPESSQNYLIRFFILPNAQCSDKKSLQSFCAFVQSFDGFQTLVNDGSLVPDPSDPDYANLTNPARRAAKVCGTTPEAIHAALCSKAEAAKQWEYAMAECPVEGRAMFIRDCVKPSVATGEGAGRLIKRTPEECAKAFDSRPKKPH